MGLMNLLGVSINIFTETYTVDINFIGKFIGILVGAVGVGFGIILFSLVLKVITLPFDVMQRVTMRKQNIKMKENQERMEKLQKQYANDKDAYNQKVMEMYKENGMSMFSSCLPMILSMIIFFVAIGAFNSYSAYANVENYNDLVGAYNSVLVEKLADLDDGGVLVTEYNPVLLEGTTETDYYEITYTVKDETAGNDKVLYYTVTYVEKDLRLVEYNQTNPAESVRYYFDENGEKVAYTASEITAYVKGADNKAFFIDTEKLEGDEAAYKAYLDDVAARKTALKEADDTMTDATARETAYRECFESIAQKEVVAAYNGEAKFDGTGNYEGVVSNTKFFWIKNIWVTDAMYKNPVLEYNDFATAIATKSGCSCSTTNKAAHIKAYTKDGYNTVTKMLDKHKSEYNGYFVLIALSIGTILLQQFVSMRSQKEQQKYSSVDGQGAGQQKMMMVIMTGMFAIFAFMYSAAFSIYLIVSNVFSLLSTLVINKFVDKSSERKDAKAAEAKFDSRYGGRVAAAQAAGKKAALESKDKKSAKKNDATKNNGRK